MSLARMSEGQDSIDFEQKREQYNPEYFTFASKQESPGVRYFAGSTKAPMLRGESLMAQPQEGHHVNPSQSVFSQTGNDRRSVSPSQNTITNSVAKPGSQGTFGKERSENEETDGVPDLQMVETLPNGVKRKRKKTINKHKK